MSTSNNFKKNISLFYEWSQHTEIREDGWQSFFPLYEKLIACAMDLMKDKFAPNLLNDLEVAWTISEEREDMVVFLEENYRDVNLEYIHFLANAKNSSVRWQTYSAFESSKDVPSKLVDIFQERILLEDDDYCLRRLLLMLKKRGCLELNSLEKKDILSKTIDPIIIDLLSDS